MTVRRIPVFLTGAAIVWGTVLGRADAAMVKPIENLSGMLAERQVKDLAESYKQAAMALRRSMERMVDGMALDSPAALDESLRMVADTRRALSAARGATTTLSTYVAARRDSLQGEDARFVPLAELDGELEAPYHRAMGEFLDASSRMLKYAAANFAAVSRGGTDERKQYEGLYQEYLHALNAFNEASATRSRRLNEWLNRYADIDDLIPQ